VIDETSDDKKGVKTPGVKRQYSGSAGKVDNCVVSVHLSYVAGDFHVLLPGQLFLPQEWSADRDRCREAGIPDEVVHRPKWQIALEQRDWAVANGVRLEWLAGDEGYGRAPAFLFALDDRGQRYVLEVPSDFHVWSRRPEVLVKEHHGAEGTRRRRVKVRSQPTREVRDLVRYSPAFRGQRWETFHVKDTTRGPVVWEAKAAKVYLKRDGRPTWPHWLVVARNVLDPEELRYWVSNAAEGTPLEVLLHVGFQRYHVESCFEEEKGELGLDHCEVRNYRSLQRHYLLTSVSHLFLAKARAALGEKKPRPDGLPGASGDGGLGPLVLAGTA
jgi:SRSO17 transposase